MLPYIVLELGIVIVTLQCLYNRKTHWNLIILICSGSAFIEIVIYRDKSCLDLIPLLRCYKNLDLFATFDKITWGPKIFVVRTYQC